MSTADTDTSTSVVEVTAPLVFSCSTCKTIVGDSYAFTCSNENTKSITLSAASNIQRSAVVHTSKFGYDIGSTYFSFSCINCKTTFGKYYITTSRDLDELREKFTFSCEFLSTYELGKSKFGKIDQREELIFGNENGIVANNPAIEADILKVGDFLFDFS